MAVFDEESALGLSARRPALVHEIGQILDTLSLGELEERLEVLRGEIARLEKVIDGKRASKRAADAFFR